MPSDLSIPVLTYGLRPEPPALRLPPGACDSHVHIFGPGAQFPYAPERGFTPVDAPKECLFALHRTLGISRCVIVQSMVHGHDNRVVEDAIAAGGGHYLGVAPVPLNVADAELQRLAAAGIRGLRFHFMKHLSSPASDTGLRETLEAVQALSHRLKPLGMHLQVHFESSLIHSLAAPLSRSAVPVVIDHMGRVDATQGVNGADFAALFALLRNPLFRVKVSGIDRVDEKVTPGTAPGYPHGIELARTLVQHYPDQCLWGTDWPHPNHTHVPKDATLVDALARIAPTAELLHKLLVGNPVGFYGF